MPLRKQVNKLVGESVYKSAALLHKFHSSLVWLASALLRLAAGAMLLQLLLGRRGQPLLQLLPLLEALVALELTVEDA